MSEEKPKMIPWNKKYKTEEERMEARKRQYKEYYERNKELVKQKALDDYYKRKRSLNKCVKIPQDEYKNFLEYQKNHAKVC